MKNRTNLIEDINRVISENAMSIDLAEIYLKNYLNSSKVELFDKVNLLTALKSIFSKEWVHNIKIEYCIEDFSNIHALAYHEATRGDGKIILGVDIDFLINADKLSFLKTIMHEYGHLNEFLKCKKGRKKRESVFLSENIVKENKWQIMGALARYGSCGSERKADNFANSRLRKWLNNETKNGTNKSVIIKAKKELKISRTKESTKYFMCKMFYGVWHSVNKICRIKESENCWVFANKISDDERIWETNSKYPISFTNKDKAYAKSYIKYHKTKKDKSIKGLSYEKKLKSLVGAFEKYSIVMADKKGISPDEFGLMYSQHYKKAEYIRTRETNPQSSLQGYFVYPTKRVQEVESIGEFLEELDCCYRENMCSEQEL